MSPLLIGLFAYAAVSAALCPHLMRACRRWQCEAPRLGLVLWVLLTTSWIVSVISAGLAATGQLSGGLGLAGLLHACLRALLTILGVSDPAEVPAAVALLGSVLVILRLFAVAARRVARTKHHRNRHRRAVRACSDTFRHKGFRIDVLDSEELAAYCVPGRAPAIVLTTGVFKRLSRDQQVAVIAHEVAHLRGKHHLSVGWASVLAEAFPFVPLLRAAPQEVARLVEWIADDRAGRLHGNRVVARALSAMATAGRESTRSSLRDVTLPAAGSGVPERVKRLLRPEVAVGSAYWRITAALTMPVLAFVAAVAVVVPCATVDPEPLCAGNPSVREVAK